MVSVVNVTVTHGQSFAAANLFAAHDAENNPLTQFGLKDHRPDVEFGATSSACSGENHPVRGGKSSRYLWWDEDSAPQICLETQSERIAPEIGHPLAHNGRVRGPGRRAWRGGSADVSAGGDS